jgi:hypothetical protein
VEQAPEDEQHQQRLLDPHRDRGLGLARLPLVDPQDAPVLRDEVPGRPIENGGVEDAGAGDPQLQVRVDDEGGDQHRDADEQKRLALPLA